MKKLIKGFTKVGTHPTTAAAANVVQLGGGAAGGYAVAKERQKNKGRSQRKPNHGW